MLINQDQLKYHQAEASLNSALQYDKELLTVFSQESALVEKQTPIDNNSSSASQASSSNSTSINTSVYVAHRRYDSYSPLTEGQRREYYAKILIENLNPFSHPCGIVDEDQLAALETARSPFNNS